jgi:hypothetical protein
MNEPPLFPVTMPRRIEPDPSGRVPSVLYRVDEVDAFPGVVDVEDIVRCPQKG